MLRQNSILEVVRGTRIYHLHLPSDAPLGELHDVLYQMRSFVVEKINRAIEEDKVKSIEQHPEE